MIFVRACAPNWLIGFILMPIVVTTILRLNGAKKFQKGSTLQKKSIETLQKRRISKMQELEPAFCAERLVGVMFWFWQSSGILANSCFTQKLVH